MMRLTIRPEYCTNVQQVIADAVPYYANPYQAWVGESSYQDLENFNLLREYAYLQLLVPDVLTFTLSHCLKNANDPQDEIPYQSSSMKPHLFAQSDARLEIVQYCNNLLIGTGRFDNTLSPVTEEKEIASILY